MKRKRITKTHEEAEMEKRIADDDSTCPYCGERAWGGLSCREETGGLFFSKVRYYTQYSCRECGTEWEVDE